MRGVSLYCVSTVIEAILQSKIAQRFLRPQRSRRRARAWRVPTFFIDDKFAEDTANEAIILASCRDAGVELDAAASPKGQADGPNCR